MKACMNSPGLHMVKRAAAVRVLQQILQSIKEFAESYVDDISVFSDLWQSHLVHIKKFLQVIKDSGFVLNLKKTSLAQSQVKFLGHIIGSGQRKANLDKVRVVHEMKRPENKKQVRQVLGFSLILETIYQIFLLLLSH